MYHIFGNVVVGKGKGALFFKAEDSNYWLTKLREDSREHVSSDYNDSDLFGQNLATANVAALMSNRFENLTVMMTIADDDDIGEKWHSFFDQPYFGDVQNTHGVDVEKFAKLDTLTPDGRGPQVKQDLKRRFAALGEFAEHPNIGDKEIAILESRLIVRLVEATEKFRQPLQFITDNPGRQWTASFNPRITDPRTFYKQPYTPTYVGVPPEVCNALLMIWYRDDNIWAILPRDCFNYIMNILCYTWYDDPIIKKVNKTMPELSEGAKNAMARLLARVNN